MDDSQRNSHGLGWCRSVGVCSCEIANRVWYSCQRRISDSPVVHIAILLMAICRHASPCYVVPSCLIRPPLSLWHNPTHPTQHHPLPSVQSASNRTFLNFAPQLCTIHPELSIPGHFQKGSEESSLSFLVSFSVVFFVYFCGLLAHLILM